MVGDGGLHNSGLFEVAAFLYRGWRKWSVLSDYPSVACLNYLSAISRGLGKVFQTPLSV